jgi:hypothetical protein
MSECDNKEDDVCRCPNCKAPETVTEKLKPVQKYVSDRIESEKQMERFHDVYGRALRVVWLIENGRTDIALTPEFIALRKAIDLNTAYNGAYQYITGTGMFAPDYLPDDIDKK